MVRRQSAMAVWREIPNDGLTLADIPSADALWDEISTFALNYYRHTNDGSLPDYSYRKEPPMRGTLDELRAWLFGRQRAIRHMGQAKEKDWSSCY